MVVFSDSDSDNTRDYVTAKVRRSQCGVTIVITNERAITNRFTSGHVLTIKHMSHHNVNLLIELYLTIVTMSMKYVS